VETRITFFGQIFEWESRIATLLDHALVYLRHAGVSKSYNAWKRHRRDLRTTSKVSSVMRTIHLMMDMFSGAVSDCLVQEIPYLEVSSDDPSVDIREQSLICLMEQGKMNISIGGSASSLLNDTDKTLFENFEAEFWTAAAQATREPSKPLTLKVRDYAMQAVHEISRVSPKQGTEGGGLEHWAKVSTTQATPRCLKKEHAILLFFGLTPSKGANRNSPGFWASESETSKIMLERFLQWEVALTSNQGNG